MSGIYAYRDGEKWVGPVPMVKEFAGIKGWGALTDRQRAKHGWYPCTVLSVHNPITERLLPDPEFVLAKGIVRIEYAVEQLPLQQCRERLLSAVVGRFGELMATDILYPFPGGADLIQMRNEADRDGLKSFVSQAHLAMAAGSSDPIAFMPASNRPQQMAPKDAVEMGLYVGRLHDAIRQALWKHKADIRALATHEEASRYDLRAHWPAVSRYRGRLVMK